MSITFPLSAATFWETLRFASRPEFTLSYNTKQSMDGGGNILGAIYGPAKWAASVGIEGGRHNANLDAEASLKALVGRFGTFLAYDIRRPWPASDPDGLFLAGGSMVGLGGEAAYGDVSLGVYRYEGGTVTLTQAASVVGDAGTYFDADGVLQASAVNTLRVDYGPFANLLDLRYVNAFDNAYWTKTSGLITATANTTVAPDGTTAADTITVAASAGIGIYAVVGVAPSTQYTFSMYVRLGTMAAADFKLAFRDDTAGVFIATDVVPTQVPTASGWTRISYTVTTPVGCLLLRAYAFRNSAAVAGTVFLWGAVLNAGATALTYPRVPLGVLDEKATTNKVTCRKHDPTDTTNLTKAGDAASTLTCVSDSAALLASGLSTICANGNVYKLDNSAGVAQAFAFLGGTNGNTNPHSVQAFVRGGSGGVGNTSNGVRTAFTPGDMYRPVSALNFTPTMTNHQMVVTALAGQIVYFILPQMEEAATISRPIIGSTLATVSRAMDTLTPRAKGTNSWTIHYDDGSIGAAPSVVGGWALAASALARPWVKSWTATRITQPSASTVQIKSKGVNNRSLALKGLPPFFIVTKGDKISVLYSTTKYFLCEAMETVVADYLGETVEFEISPAKLPATTAVNDAVTLRKPVGKFKITEQRAASGQGNISSGLGFSMIGVP